MLSRNGNGVLVLGIFLAIACASAPVLAKDVVEHEPPQPEPARPAPVKEIDISGMSLAELDRRCEDAREERIAPLREAEIEQCIET